MKRIKLDDIKQKVPFEVPQDYFDGLAHKIQARAVDQEKKSGFISLPLPVRLAIPAFVIALLAVIFWPNTSQSNLSAEQLLAEVSTEAIVDYLYDSEVTTEELLVYYELDFSDEEAIEEDIWDQNIDSAELENLLLDYEITGEYL